MMRGGYTIVEIVVVVFVVGFILVTIINAYADSLDNQRLNESAENIASLMQKARGQTIASRDDSGVSGSVGKIYAVHIDDKNSVLPNRAVLFVADAAGYAYSASDSRNIVYQLPASMSIESVIFYPNTAGVRPEVYFKRLTGEGLVRDASNNLVSIQAWFGGQAVTLITSRKSGKSRVVNVFSSGAIEVD